VRIAVDSLKAFLEFRVDFQFSLQVAFFPDFGLATLRMHNPDGFEFYVVHFSIFSSRSLLLPALLRRDSTSQEFAIQVGTPRRGSTQRINTIYTAKTATNPNQSGINFISSCAINDW
jgi:hypothetical protein